MKLNKNETKTETILSYVLITMGILIVLGIVLHFSGVIVF